MTAFRQYFEDNPEIFAALVAAIAILGGLLGSIIGAKIQADKFGELNLTDSPQRGHPLCFGGDLCRLSRCGCRCPSRTGRTTSQSSTVGLAASGPNVDTRASATDFPFPSFSTRFTTRCSETLPCWARMLQAVFR
ncbi:hypothetical protein [Streptomyces sp. NPDC001809]